MQSDLFLPEEQCKLNELRLRKRELERASRELGEEIYATIKQGTSAQIGKNAYICYLPSGGVYFYTMDGYERPGVVPRLHEFHQITLGDLAQGVNFLRSIEQQMEQERLK